MIQRSKIMHVVLLFVVLMSMAGMLALTHFPLNQQQGQSNSYQNRILGANIVRAQSIAPTPFMHRPYYGSQTILQRTTSFVDHDKPWYVNDGIFVRYDGARWTNVGIGNCTGGVNCYDGHNGYDLNLWYEPVLSVAAGTVIRAGWYDPYNHQSALGLWAAVDHGNGYVTAYGHLSALTVANGDKVGTQWQLGTSGTSGSSTGPHLHMATYYLPNWNATDPFGWTGNYPDPNVVPDNFLWVDSPGTSYTVPDLSHNGNAVYPGATLVDDSDTGWSSTGSWTRDTSSSAIKGGLHWAATSSGAATATATWQPKIPADGYYEVGAFVNDTHASSSWAPYTIYSADPNQQGGTLTHTAHVDETHVGSFQGPFGWENTGPQWISLGTYYFRASMSGHIVLSNATGENGVQVSADGMEFVPVSEQAPPPPTPSPSPTPSPTPTPTPTSLPSPVFGFAVTSDGTPAVMLPNSTSQVNITLKNTSNFTWKSTGSSAVQLLYRWLNAQKQVVAIGNPLALPQDVPVNASVSLGPAVQTPAQVGAYTLQWDLLQAGKTFSQQGAQVRNDTVEVARYAALPKLYYFSEGYTGAGTAEYLSLTNPSINAATVTVTYLYQKAASRTQAYRVPAQSHSVLNINQQAGANQAVSMIVQGDQPFVAERTMYTQKGSFVSASDSVGSAVLSTNWYFAEGNTTFGWDTLLAVMNPSNQPVTMNIAYLLGSRSLGPHGSHLVASTYLLPARSRSTIVLNNAMPNQQFGMVVTASAPILVERPEYLMQSSLRGGNSVVGATSPQTSWYFGGGNTSAGFNERLVLANPSSSAAAVQLRYLTANGQVITQNVSIPVQSRIEVNVNSAVKSTLHSTVITASVPIVAERQDFFATSFNGAIAGSTTTMGSSSAHTSWYLAQGDTTGGHAEYLAIANPNAVPASLQVVYYLAGGTPIVKTYTIAANSRLTVNLLSDVGSNKAIGTAIYATLPVVTEQVMFFNLHGATGGYASMAFGQ